MKEQVCARSGYDLSLSAHVSLGHETVSTFLALQCLTFSTHQDVPRSREVAGLVQRRYFDGPVPSIDFPCVQRTWSIDTKQQCQSVLS